LFSCALEIFLLTYLLTYLLLASRLHHTGAVWSESQYAVSIDGSQDLVHGTLPIEMPPTTS